MFIYEHLFPPYDEGIKKFSFMTYKQLCKQHDVTLVRNYNFLQNSINSLLFLPRVLLICLFIRPEKIVYIPQAALTFSSIIKIWVLGLLYTNRLSVVGVQKRTLKPWQYNFAKKINMGKLFVLSHSMIDEARKLGKTAQTIKVGIDREKYTPANNIDALKDKYNIPKEKSVLLHVGHIKESRNILWFKDVQQALPDIQVVIIGSTATQQENEIYDKLTEAGVMVLRDFFPDIQEIYQLSSWYCFPVQHEAGAMETPLSVLEGMATNLPIITTRFGCLVDLFNEDEAYRYVDSSNEIIEILKTDFGKECNNRSKTEPFTWQRTADKLMVN